MPDRTPEVQRTLAQMNATVSDLRQTVGRLEKSRDEMEKSRGRVRWWIVGLVLAVLFAFGSGGVGLYAVSHSSHDRAHEACTRNNAIAGTLTRVLDEVAPLFPGDGDAARAIQDLRRYVATELHPHGC